MKKKVRIIKRTYPDGSIRFVIQQRHYLLRLIWVDAWINCLAGACCQDSFSTFEEAEKNLCYFDGTKAQDEIVLEK